MPVIKNMTVREACRRRRPLDGADSQALEHALTITERERDCAREDHRHWQVKAETAEAERVLVAHVVDNMTADRDRFRDKCHQLCNDLMLYETKCERFREALLGLRQTARMRATTQEVFCRHGINPEAF